MKDWKLTTRKSYESPLYVIEEFSSIGTCEVQEDATGCLMEGNTAVLVVCDGIGGLERGDLAARTATDTVLRLVSEYDWREAPSAFLRYLLEETNEAVFQMRDEKGRSVQGGCTLALALIAGRKLYVANVGDSRVYLIKKGASRQLSVDHNYAGQLARQLKANEITQAEYEENIPRGAALTSYIGMGELREWFLTEEPVLLDRDEIVFLESDGLYKLLNDREIMEQIRANIRELNTAGEALLREAETRAGKYQDNTSIVLFRIK